MLSEVDDEVINYNPIISQVIFHNKTQHSARPTGSRHRAFWPPASDLHCMDAPPPNPIPHLPDLKAFMGGLWSFCRAKRRSAARSRDVFSRRRLRWLVLLDPEYTCREKNEANLRAPEEVQRWRWWHVLCGSSGRGGGGGDGGDPSSDWLVQETPLQLKKQRAGKKKKT